MIYIREAHPTDGWQVPQNERDKILIKDPTTLAERKRAAADFATQFQVTLPILVDPLDDPFDNAFAAWPDRIYVLDAAGKVAFKGRVDEARERLRPVVRLRTREADGAWRAALPATARNDGGEWIFELPASGPEPLLKALIDGGAGIETLAIERPGLHEAFVAIAGDAAARAMEEEEPGE